ncbi:MAG: hypothetical protein AB1646_17135 [Thermodesulfobacteriota bacterium]
MKSICILACLATVLSSGLAVGQSDSGGGPLIPVLPSYQEAAYSPEPQGSDPFSGDRPYSPPKPQDQLYLFWFLGQVISYPVDKVESFIAGWRSRKSSDPGRTYEFNPFASAAIEHIPPAPPVTAGPSASSGR